MKIFKLSVYSWREIKYSMLANPLNCLGKKFISVSTSLFLSNLNPRIERSNPTHHAMKVSEIHAVIKKISIRLSLFTLKIP